MAAPHPLRAAISYLSPRPGDLADGDVVYRKMLADALQSVLDRDDPPMVCCARCGDEIEANYGKEPS